MTNDSLTQTRLQLLARGYHIIPTRGKVPAIAGWQTQDYLDRELQPVGPKGSLADRLVRWPRRWPGAHSTGVRVEDGLIVIDIDVDDGLVVDELMRWLSVHAPQVARLAPLRYGASPHKLALFARIGPGDDLFIRRASRKYDGHQVEVFGGEKLSGERCSRQFVVDGPHSYHDDGSVAAFYSWAEGPALFEVELEDLPQITRTQISGLIDFFEVLARQAGWQMAATPDVEQGAVVYDITEATRFDTNRGDVGLDYAGLCDAYAVYGDSLRCSRNFMPGRGDSGRTDTCLIGDQNRHGVVAVWVPGDEVLHYPAELEPVALDEPGLADMLQQVADANGIQLAKEPKTLPANAKLEDFYAFLPTHQYIYRHTGALWPLASINSALNKITVGEKAKKQSKKDQEAGAPPEMVEVQITPSLWLDRHAAVMGMTWAPGLPQLIGGRLPLEDGWAEQYDAATFNKYHPPARPSDGEAQRALRWREFIARIYPDHVDHIVAFLAHRVQRPAEKINHGLVLTGSPGIGKDTLLEPLRHGVGPWNFRDISPHDLMSNYTDFMQCVVLRVSETRDLGDISRYAFYEATKTILAAPPTMARVNIKHVPQFYVPNVVAAIFTTNYPADGLFLPPDDRRHYVCGTELVRNDVWDAHCAALWAWYAGGGIADVVAYLADYDLSRFNAGAPPEKTAAFLTMVDTGRPGEESEIRDAIDILQEPAALTVADLERHVDPAMKEWLKDRRNARNVARRLDACGYVQVRNATEEGRWKVMHKNVSIYGRKDLPPSDRFKAAEALKAASDATWKALQEQLKPNSGGRVPKSRRRGP